MISIGCRRRQGRTGDFSRSGWFGHGHGTTGPEMLVLALSEMP